MEAFGPLLFGPLASTSSGHGNDSGRAVFGLQNIFNRTGDISQVALEAARNELTYTQEFKWGDVFMNFNYQNRNGKWYSGGRALQELSDPTEIGGDRINRVIMAQDRMMTDPTIAEAIVVSEDLGYGRHFIYRYRRGEDSDIEGLAFEFQGSKDELGRVLRTLGRDAADSKNSENSAAFVKPLFFTKENQHDTSDLSKAAFGSFNTEERRNEMSSYLTRLQRDTAGYEALVHRRQQQEKELQNQYEKLILKDENAKTGIASAVYGMINAAEKMAASESRKREELAIPDTVTQTPEKYARVIQDKFRSLAFGMIAIPRLIDHTGRLLDQSDVAKTNYDGDDITKNAKIDIQGTEQITKQVIEPVVPGITGITENIGDLLEEEMIWQEFISIILKPSDSELSNTYTPTDKEEREEMLLGLIIYKHTEPVNEIQKSSQTERLTVLKSGLQQGLENIAEVISMDEFSGLGANQKIEELERQKTVEADVVKLGKEIVGMILFSENKKQSPQGKKLTLHVDSLVRLSFLIDVYRDRNSKDVVKHLLVVLIYKQIEKIYEDKEMSVLYPELAIFLGEFTKLYKDTGFLERKFNLLILCLGKIDSAIILNENEFESTNKDYISRIIFMIFKNLQRQISAEKLPHRNTFATTNINSTYPAKKKKQSKYGIIYWFNKEVVYQYSSLLVTQSSL